MEKQATYKCTTIPDFTNLSSHSEVNLFPSLSPEMFTQPAQKYFGFCFNLPFFFFQWHFKWIFVDYMLIC